MGFLKKLGNFIISRKFIINFVLFCLVWVVVIWGSAKYFDSYSRHGETIDVPSLLNNNVKDIEVLIGDRDIRYEILDSIYNPDLVERSEEHTSELQSRPHLVCRLLLEK